ncbi:YcaO-like family protein [Streptomyces sp. ISL-1]|uniref:YcaO-like family protein n=1 Tax=Streptomyces sp. ISL-1 TaxID=2817657 RepID=UPI001BECF717|nr:YcaO-like family protein [Streptomyces sp. ISL-1]MBT2392600.1 YcaO-like family protein [Streptomyces sp. ISL-1]
MIDFLATLDPHNGLAEKSGMLPPTPPDDLLWRALVRLSRGTGRAENTGHALSPCVVGAYGHSRMDALVRGAGEAVERYALFPDDDMPHGTVRATRAALGARALSFSDAGVALGDSRNAERTLTWYPTHRLRDGAEILVPAGLVDYPAHTEEAEGFDPGPSGAASGHGYDMALRSALLEMIERDALLVAWERRLRPLRIDVDAVEAGPVRRGRENAHWRSLLRLWASARRAGLVPVVADLPTAVPGVVCTVGVIIDETGPQPLATVGCNATDQVGWSMLGALQEALQIRSAVVNQRESHGYGEAPSDIVDDDDRLRYVASRQCFDLVSEWAGGFRGPRGPRTERAVTTAAIVGGLLADGADPLAIDLTGRLPVALREMGWAAVKVVPVGYQQLRMTESYGFSWNTERLRTAESRTGLAADGRPACRNRPHPLP